MLDLRLYQQDVSCASQEMIIIVFGRGQKDKNGPALNRHDSKDWRLRPLVGGTRVRFTAQQLEQVHYTRRCVVDNGRKEGREEGRKEGRKMTQSSKGKETY